MISLALRHARTYPAATQKCVADLCLAISITMHVQMHVHIRHVAIIDNYVRTIIIIKRHARSKHHDDDKLNALAFVISTRQKFPNPNLLKVSTFKE